jgi:DNA-binding transcriptional MerR regulator
MLQEHEQRTFTISKCADELGVTSSWLRFGERLGALPLARRTPNGWRYYTHQDIARLRRLGVGQRKRRLAVPVGESGRDEPS